MIDIEQALQLYAELGSWRCVAERLNARGANVSAKALTVAATHWRRQQGLARRSYEVHGDGAIWRPAAPRAWRIVPDYATGTVRRA